MTILCATDFSPSSRRAAELAAASARRLGDTLILVHVLEPMLQAVPFALPGAAVWQGEMKASAEATLAEEVKALRERGVVAEAEFIVGNPADALLSLIEQRQPRLLVMGTHGRKGVGRFFLGSVADEVVKASPRPVLIARGDVSERWMGGAPLRLAIGLDGTRVAESVMAWLATLPAHFSEPTLIRLYWPFEEAIRYGIDEPWQGTEANPVLLPLLERDVRQLARPFVGEDNLRLSFCMAHVNAAEVILTEATRLGADALVVGVPHGKLEAWNALDIDDVLHTGTLPVFCVPQVRTAASKRLPEFRTVLVVTDLSDASNQAILSAYGAVRPGGRIELVHVHVHEIRSGLSSPFAASSRVDVHPLTEERRRSIEAHLESLIPAEAAGRGISTRISVIDAPIASVAILQAAERLNADVIAMASHHRSGVKRAVLGSVAEEVTRRSPRPVLITSIGTPG
jgi:nucleotide-binding universal stress UspA family protein